MTPTEQAAYDQSYGAQVATLRKRTLAIIDSLPRPLRWLARLYMRRVLRGAT